MIVLAGEAPEAILSLDVIFTAPYFRFWQHEADTVFSSDSDSVTRLGDLLHFGQLFKGCGNN